LKKRYIRGSFWNLSKKELSSITQVDIA
jgi:hypothetical protein